MPHLSCSWIIFSAKVEEDPTNRFFIGEAFLQTPNNETVVVPESLLESKPPPPPPPQEDIASQPNTSNESIPVEATMPSAVTIEIGQPAPFQPPNDLTKYCKMCDISVTSEMHMRLHLAGAKHAKKLRQLGEPPYTEELHTLSQCILDDAPAKRPKTTTPQEGSTMDFSVFRTPSGQFYCQVCDLSVTSEVTLSQHFASKRHIKTAKRK